MPLLRPRDQARCRQVRRVLPGYLDGQIDADTAWRVSRHLSECEDCFQDADVIRTLKDVLARLHIPPDAAVRDRLHRIVAMITEPPTQR